MSKAPGDSYGQILKSSVLIGGSSVINVLFGVIRNKALAVLLGPAGIGLVGVLTSIIGTVGILAGVGLGYSGVRQIAVAVGTGDDKRIARTIINLRRAILVLGALGSVLLFCLSKPVCQLTFGNDEHTNAIRFLSVTILFSAVAAGQRALVQGMRRVADLAKVSVLGAFLGTVLSVPLVWLLGDQGIVPFLLITYATSVLASWWYARTIQVIPVAVSWKETGMEFQAVFKLGSAFIGANLIAALVIYLTRALMVQRFGIDAAGQYQAALSLSAVYGSFILQAMGADFYPRLTAVAMDHAQCNRLVQEQAEVSLLLATPGILATLTFAPFVISLFYSRNFGPAVEILRWQVLGTFLQVASSPMAYVLQAKGNAKLYFFTEALLSGVYLGLFWLAILYWKMTGAGMAFFGQYVFYWIFLFIIVRRLTGFAWSAQNLRVAFVLMPSVAGVFLCPLLLPSPWCTVVSGVITLVVGVYALRTLLAVLGPARVSRLLNKVRRSLGLAV